MMATEWEHMRLRMKINDFIEQKRDIENVKVVKKTTKKPFVKTFLVVHQRNAIIPEKQKLRQETGSGILRVRDRTVSFSLREPN